MQRCALLSGLLFTFLLLASCGKEKSDSATTGFAELNFRHTMEGDSLKLNALYENAFAEDLVITRLKYYVSNIKFINPSTTVSVPETYFLVDESSEPSKTIRIPVTPDRYTTLSFLIGVDSARNVSGAQTGALDPMQDMFWTWNTGYIMAKLEGLSSVSTAPNSRIQYHIGGFSGPTSALRTVVIPLPAGTELGAGQTLRINLAGEIDNWFQSIHDLPITGQATIMTPSAVSAQFADNYATMFTLTGTEIK